MTRDYYPILKRATAALGSQTAQARRAVYDRARSFIAAAGLSARQASDERAAVEAAIKRIEAEREPTAAARPPLRRPIESPGARSARPLQAWWPLAAASTALLVGGLATWALWPNEAAEPGASTKRAAAVPAVPAAPEARPGTAPRSFVFNRQIVYYRTVQPVGTIHIAKAQQFLYLVVANTSAVRYTLAVGRECAGIAGLLVVSAKEESAASLRQRVADVGQPEPRPGRRSLVLGDADHRVHGPTTTGEAGCFSLVAEDIVHLYGRVPVGTRVVIN
jgi:lipoprotein-anchoring transpeptidase ErfK/SrfK